MVDLITSGPGQNSYVSFDDANAILLTCSATFMTPGTQLTLLDVHYLLEAARDLDQLWEFAGQPSDYAQPMAWPRRYVMRPGFRLPSGQSWWNNSSTYDEDMRFKIDFLSAGQPGIPFLDPAVVPPAVLEAQALLAVLRKTGGNLIGDNQGDTNGLQLDTGFKIAYVNAVRQAADIHKRLAPLGTFLGDGILRTTRHG